MCWMFVQYDEFETTSEEDEEEVESTDGDDDEEEVEGEGSEETLKSVVVGAGSVFCV